MIAADWLRGPCAHSLYREKIWLSRTYSRYPIRNWLYISWAPHRSLGRSIVRRLLCWRPQGYSSELLCLPHHVRRTNSRRSLHSHPLLRIRLVALFQGLTATARRKHTQIRTFVSVGTGQRHLFTDFPGRLPIL